VWTEGASGEAEEMLDRMLQGVLKLARKDIAVVTLARVRDDPANFRAALLAELDRLKPGLLLVMGTLGTRAILGGTSEPAESRAEWHVLEGAAQMWAVKITHHPEHIRLRAAAGDPIPRREAFEDLQAVAARL
jgi:uracil-DNA glycosylase